MWGNEKYIKERMSEITSFFYFYRNIVVLAAAVATDGDPQPFAVQRSCRVATIF